MPKATRVCKICGKEYPYCKTFAPTGVFRWQDVACCEEHGQEYLRRVLIARGQLKEQEEVTTVPEPKDDALDTSAQTKRKPRQRKKNKIENTQAERATNV